jgi:hypothetical protein
MGQLLSPILPILVLYSLLCLVIFQYFVGAGAGSPFFACSKLFLHSDVVDIVPGFVEKR